MDDKKDIKYRVDSLQAIFLISASLSVDIVQALLNLFAVGVIVNRAMTPFVWLFFLTWFYFLGIKFTKGGGKNLGTSIISMILEMIPFLDLLPGWTVATILLINASRREDKGKKPLKKKGRKPDALDDLNKKKNRTREDNVKLTKAEEIMKKGSISNQELNDPVLKAAWEKKQQGQGVFDGTVGNKDGYEFSNKKILNGPANRQEMAEGLSNIRKKRGMSDVIQHREGGGGNEIYDTRTKRYKKQQGHPEQEDLAEFEELPSREEEQESPLLNELEGGQDKQEFSMGDIYREPIDITSKKPKLDANKKQDESSDMKMAA